MQKSLFELIAQAGSGQAVAAHVLLPSRELVLRGLEVLVLVVGLIDHPLSGGVEELILVLQVVGGVVYFATALQAVHALPLQQSYLLPQAAQQALQGLQVHILVTILLASDGCQFSTDVL